MELLTQQLSDELCDAVFSTEIKDILKITLANKQVIPLSKQFYSFYRNRFLLYSKEDTITEMALIFEYSQQEINKLKLYKSKLEIINTPESFFLTRINDVADSSNNNSLTNEKSDSITETKNLTLTRTDNLNLIKNESIVRTGNSAINEDFTQVESNWTNKDKSLLGVGRDKSLLDITTDSLNLESVSIKNNLEIKAPSPEEKDEAESNEVAYTNLALNKSLINNKQDSISTTKNFNTSKNSNNLSKNSIITGVSNKTMKSLQLEFTYNQATIQAFDTYIANFRESFFNSFSSLFVPYWNGYSN